MWGSPFALLVEPIATSTGTLRRMLPHDVARVYIGSIIVVGAVAVTIASLTLIRHHPPIDFYYLAALTAVSGLLPVKVPKVSANISVSETFVYAGTLLLGPAAGVMLVVIDALIIWVKIWATAGIKIRRMLFSMAASALAIGLAGVVLFLLINSPPLVGVRLEERPDVWRFSGGLVAFSSIYFFLNTWLVAGAIAVETRGSAPVIWRANFSNLWLNYLAGASLAMLLVYQTRAVNPAFLVVVVPLVLVMFLTYRWSAARIEEAESHLEQMNKTFLQTIEAFAMTVDAKDNVTHGHIRRVQRYSMELAKALGVDSPQMLDALRAAALLHDTGKVAVPEYILNKPGRLTPDEYERMKLHASIGADILKSIDFPYPIEPIVRHHHENWDGTGYPAGLRGAEIPIGARILSVVDCYDAVRSDRPYRTRMSRSEAEQVLRDRRGTMYDPQVLDVFLSQLDRLETLVSAEADPPAAPAPMAAIAAAAREQQEFHRAGAATTTGGAPDPAAIILWHLRPIAPPASTVLLFRPVPKSNELVVVSAAGVGADALTGLRVPVGGGITGWVCAERQPVMNSDAALDLGQLARQPDLTLEYALSVPVLSDNQCVLVASMYGRERFTDEHREVLTASAQFVQFGLSPDSD